MEYRDVVIVGGGPAGMSAAVSAYDTLIAEGKEPKVLMDTNSTSIPSPESLPEIDQQIESNPEPKSEAEETTEPEQPTTDTEDTENESA